MLKKETTWTYLLNPYAFLPLGPRKGPAIVKCDDGYGTGCAG